MDEHGEFELGFGYGVDLAEKEMVLMNNLKLDKCEVELFIKNDNSNHCFRNNKVQIRCEGDQHKQMLVFALNLLSYSDSRMIYSDRIQNNFEYSNCLAKLKRNLQNCEIDALLRCNYTIESSFTAKERNKVEEVWSPKLISSYCSDQKSSTVNLDLSLRSHGKSTVSSANREKEIQECTDFTVNFFQLAIISRNLPIVKLLIECIFNQCRKEIQEEIAEGQYIMRNLDLALNETVHCRDVNSYLNGMNALHLACFVQFKDTDDISREIDRGVDKLHEEFDAKLFFKLIRMDIRDHITSIYKSAVRTKTVNTKEIPMQIGQRLIWDERYWKWDFLSNHGKMCLKGILRLFIGYGMNNGTEYKELPVDVYGESPMHYAVRDNDKFTIKELLGEFSGSDAVTIEDFNRLNLLQSDYGIEWRTAIINQASNKGETPFHLAKTTEIVSLLETAYDGIPLKLDKNGNSTYTNLLNNDEGLAEVALDNLIRIGTGFVSNPEPANNLDSEDLHVIFNLKAFQKDEHGNNDFMMKYHKWMIKCGSELINHPIMVVVTQIKWACKSKLVRYLYPIIQLIFTTFLSWMIFCEFHRPEEKETMNITSNSNIFDNCKCAKLNQSGLSNLTKPSLHENISSNETTINFKPTEHQCFVPALVSSVCLVFMIVFELWQIARAPCNFLIKAENWLDLILIGSTVASLYTLLHDNSKSDPVSKTLGPRFFSGISIFLAWFKIVPLLQNLPKAGRYLRIFTIVAKELLFFLLIYFPILLAFAGCFFVLLPPKTNAFKDAWTSVLSILSMLVGEINFDGTFINNDNFDDETVFEKLLLQIISIGFICFVSIVISNLLTGLAIKEIDKLKSEAWQTSMLEKTIELVEDDNAIDNWLCTCFGNQLLKKSNDITGFIIKPNETVQGNSQRKLNNLWKSITGQDKSCKVYFIRHQKFDEEESDIMFPPELTKLCMDHLRKKEKLKELKEEEDSATYTIKGVIERVDGNEKRMKCVLKTLKKISEHSKIDVNNIKVCDCGDFECNECADNYERLNVKSEDYDHNYQKALNHIAYH